MDQVSSHGRESAKQRARRIPLDYHRQRAPLDTTRRRLTWVASAAAGIYAAWVIAGGLLEWPIAVRHFSPAPLADAHAAWSDDCAACHVMGANVRSDGVAIGKAASVLAGSDRSPREIADARCSACHAGPAHHGHQVAGEIESCAACHRDHLGRDTDLKRVADAVCTRCHGDLSWRRQSGSESLAGGAALEDVSSWTNHPEFRSIGGKEPEAFNDPGRLKFNHALHMLPGQAPHTAQETAQKKWREIDASSWPAMIAGRDFVPEANQAVQLVCESCHLRDDATSGGLPALGAFMQPIRFERHCAACHRGELAVDADRPEESPREQVPHGLTAAQLRHYLAGLLQPLSPPPPLSPKTPLQPIPGKTLGANLAHTIDPGVARQLAAAESRLAGEHRCGKCHEFQSRRSENSVPEVEPTAIPVVWLKHARFDHAAHRAINCESCHDSKLLQPPVDVATKPPLDGEMPMIPGRAICAKCHRPATIGGTSSARTDCVECHRYHGGGLGPHGVGSLERGVSPERRQGLEQYISSGARARDSAANSANK